MSLADVMKAAGLTHGGFYRHFVSKDALLVEATSAAFEGILDTLEKSVTHKGNKAALEDYVSRYLSQRHVETPSLGCPIPAYGADVAREGAEVRAVFHGGVDRLLKWIAEGLPFPEAEATAKAMELLSLMVGAVITARASGDRAVSRKILSQARQSVGKLAKLAVR